MIFDSTTRYKAFFDNRLSKIHAGSTINEWNYVDSANNPADFTSRGIRAHVTEKWRFFHGGPAWVKLPTVLASSRWASRLLLHVERHIWPAVAASRTNPFLSRGRRWRDPEHRHSLRSDIWRFVRARRRQRVWPASSVASTSMAPALLRPRWPRLPAPMHLQPPASPTSPSASSHGAAYTSSLDCLWFSGGRRRLATSVQRHLAD